MASRRIVLACAAAGSAALGIAAAPSFAAGGGVGFAKPVVVDSHLAGGEPSIYWDSRHQDFIYTSHEGTTHTFRDGLGGAAGTADFTTNYRNQVNIWTSKDGRTWSRVDLSGTGFEASPTTNTGFSDPDLTQDAGGRIYDTGIDLANDALFSSPDGGRTWDRGTVSCHDGDRPWLAAGPKDTVWLETDPAEGSHSVYESTDGGSSCGSKGFADPAGYGKLFYDSRNKALRGALIEPVPDIRNGIGVGILRNAVHAYKTGNGAFRDYFAAPTRGELTNFPSLALDTAGNLYLTWADHPGGTKGNGKNTVWLTSSRDGVHWTPRYAVAHPGATVLWPWAVAGTPGNVSVVWYQYDRPTPDPDKATTGNVSVMDANVFGVGTRHVRSYVSNASHGPVHVGGICQSGTTCVATGQDRRLGDYFTNGLDARGCVIIATGATTYADPVTGTDKAWATPIFLRQTSGPSLTGRSCGSRQRHGAAVAWLSRVARSDRWPPLGAAAVLLALAGLLSRGQPRHRGSDGTVTGTMRARWWSLEAPS
jgi:hypothetical protein